MLDISERKRAEAELRNAEERYRLVARATNDAIRDWDLRTGQVHRNESVETLFGYSAEETADGNDWWQDHLHPEDRARVMASLGAAIPWRGWTRAAPRARRSAPS